MMKALRVVFILALLALSGYLIYELYKTIEEPIVFEQQRKQRDEATIAKLEFIREVQLAYRAQTDTFADSFDRIRSFVLNDSLDVEKVIGDPNDSTVVVKREIVKVPVRDTLLVNSGIDIDSIEFIPNSSKKFDIQARYITKNDIEIPAFQVSAPYDEIYAGLIRKYYADKSGDIMRVGSITEGTTSGNW